MKYFSVFHNTSDIPVAMDGQVHDARYEISYCLSGTAKYQIDNKWYEIKKRQIIFIPSGIVHSFKSNQSSIYSVLFSEEVFLVCPNLNAARLLENFQNPKILDLEKESMIRIQVESGLKKMRSLKSENKFYQEKFTVQLLELLIMLAEYVMSPGRPDIVREVSDFIDKNYYEEITLQNLCKKYNLNYHYFSKRFHQTTGKTFTEYLTQVRIDKAMDLLCNTTTSVAAICFETGFNDVSHFNRTFKRMAGLNPTSFRKKNKKS